MECGGGIWVLPLRSGWPMAPKIGSRGIITHPSTYSVHTSLLCGVYAVSKFRLLRFFVRLRATLPLERLQA